MKNKISCLVGSEPTPIKYPLGHYMDTVNNAILEKLLKNSFTAITFSYLLNMIDIL